ncbi:20768_t:CDS:2 [Dentiscutata erythropus]|uniref:20768_t:CDS:1 n=1 Tax=Dentiscutata erythropus TaxID=1348616 RepID=A0A9N8VKJ0_9GLOM|nr:20768_t:CDS:2 [Dentiscutata erythropus]
MLSTCLEKKINIFDPFAVSQEVSNEVENEVLVFHFDKFTAYFCDFDPHFAMNVLSKIEGVLLIEKPKIASLDRSIIDLLDGTTRSKTTLYNLDRIDTARMKYDGFYTYPTSSGKEVNVYIMDTGVRMTHDEFKDRVILGGVFCDECKDGDDEYGHGTHVAGTVAGTTYGVAKLANIINVRVGDASGSIDFLAITKGVNYVINAHKNDTKKNSIINMSFHLEYSEAMVKLVEECTDNGIHVVVSAGNSNIDACSITPAAAPSAITVACSDKSDQMAYFSNYGPCVDIYAPGVKILSAYIKSDTDNTYLDGTSMSAPHVAGAIALYISVYGNLPPSDMTNAIISLSTKNLIKEIPNNNDDSYLLRVPH